MTVNAICTHCNEIIARGDSMEDLAFEADQDLWGHIQTRHEELFDEIQNFETPDMIEECYRLETVE